MSDLPNEGQGTAGKSTTTTDAAPSSEQSPITLAAFLEDVPPAQERLVTSLCKTTQIGQTSWRYELQTPAVVLHCNSEHCNGPRIFRALTDQNRQIPGDLYIRYICSNCRSNTKLYALLAKSLGGNAEAGHCYKYGEFPVFGPPTPARLLRLFGADREVFLKGRRCENQGLGIGAFVYYRRVVESHKNQILDEIVRVAQKVSAPAEMVATLEAAKTEIQFSKALASVKNAMPQLLLIDGHNPLSLLHSALSTGLHDKSDEECLELAQSIRAVLVELAERLGQALKDEAELKTAVSRLMKVRQDK